MTQLAAIVAITVLMVPPPAQSNSILLPICGDANIRLSIPIEAPLPQGEDGHCKNICHIASKRRQVADDPHRDDDCC